MKDEYVKNQKKQRDAFKKYRKYIGKAILYGGIAVASALLFPSSIAVALKGLLGEYLGGSVAFFTQWGITAGGLIGSIVNGFKAKHNRKTIDNAQDEEENIIDRMDLEKSNAEKKSNALQKTIEHLLGKKKEKEEEKEVTKTLDDKEISDEFKAPNLVDNEKEEEKTYTKAA